GFARINPNNIPINELIPEVQIKQFRVDDQVVDHHQTIVLEPGKKRFIIDFTALSFVSPPKMQFKYKLIGMDQDWVNVGEDRQAIYTNIPYGDHEFHVIASNNDGIWNNEGAVLKFQLKPFFYQTPWIYLIVFVIFVSLGFVIYRWRVRAIEQRNEELEKQVMERTAEINSQKEEIKVQRDQLSDSFTKMKTVSEMGREITSVLSVEELVQVVYGNVKELMDCDGFGIGIYNAQAHSIEFRGYIERGKVLADEFDKLANKKLLSVHCFDTQEPIFINDLFVDSKKYFPNFEFPNHGEVPKSLIYLPLSIDERKIGLITVQSFRQDAYTAENMGFLQTLANYITIALDNAKAYEIINDKNQDITDSLRYAQTIQQAILPSTEVLTSIFANHFLLFKPKDIVSGDFYWMAEKEGHIYLAVVDCTGHGVPGAFMSMIGTELLNELSNVSQTHNPALVLSNLDRLIYKSLNQEETKNTDGMDVCLCVISKQADEVFHVKYAGAKRPLFYTQQGEFFELKGDRKHIGGIFQKMGKAKQFSMNEITLKKGDRLYLTTDGFVDQASPLRKKIGTKRLKKIIKQKQDLAMLDQGLFLENYLKEHQQDAIQRDDITILGVEL
ncbi:MAG: GAF domain-containing SpoIIE family protein phosphatase, partial [Flammeovirgaceae bacterium]